MLPNTYKLRCLFLLALFAVLAGCAAGPDFTRPDVAAPEGWDAWHSGESSLRTPVSAGPLPAEWWKSFDDPVLNELVRHALEASPDLKTAALQFARARTQQRMTSAQRMPEVNASGSATYNRLSEHGSSIRLYDEIGDQIGFDKGMVVDVLSDPYAWYQAGVDFSWEIDFWGRVARSVEAAQAEVAVQAAQLELARLSIVGDLVTAYFQLRNIQEQLRLASEDILAYRERLALNAARVEGGVLLNAELERQKGDLAALRAGLPELRARESETMNRILLLLGERPGALQEKLKASGVTRRLDDLPELSLGLPSEIALQRPDVRAAEARLHQATAKIGVARAELYPSVKLGANFGLDAYKAGDVVDWGSRTWSIGPRLDLPLFDHGRRKSTVVLREQEQQQAAVEFHKTVLAAWHEIDNALSRYAAERRKTEEQSRRENCSREAYELVKARYGGGAVNYIDVLDSRRAYLQALRDLANGRENVFAAFVSINKAVGNTHGI